MSTKRLTILLVLCSFYTRLCYGSQGDRSLWYSECTRDCRQKYNCSQSFGTFDWVHGDCFDCRYECMWETVEQFESNYGVVPQFHGKWPFLALRLPFGFIVQEPASVIFSLLNLLTVFVMLRKMKRIRDLPNRAMWISYAHVGLATWIASTLFHVADCDVTEKLDYFGAFAFVLSALYVSFIFTLPQLEFFQLGRLIKKAAPYFFVVKFLYHVRYMTFNFDYGYNMFVCISVSLVTTLLYLFYLYERKRFYGELKESHILLIRIILWANLSTALELLDFTPVFWIFDSHSLFHLATIPIPIWWAEFLEQKYQPTISHHAGLKIA